MVLYLIFQLPALARSPFSLIGENIFFSIIVFHTKNYKSYICFKCISYFIIKEYLKFMEMELEDKYICVRIFKVYAYEKLLKSSQKCVL